MFTTVREQQDAFCKNSRKNVNSSESQRKLREFNSQVAGEFRQGLPLADVCLINTFSHEHDTLIS